MKIEYNLYRAKFVRPKQRSLFDDDKTPKEIFLNAIKDKPSAEFRKNFIWHIGNINMFNDNSGYFAIGRTTKTKLSKYDIESRNFIEEQSDTSPFTYIVFDASLGLLAIAKQHNLSQYTNSIASILIKLLERTTAVMVNKIDVIIDIIPDPSSFIDKIRSVYSLKGFTASFTGPNPFDADEFFQKPLSVYLNMAKGSAGKTSIYGDDLDREVVEAVARSTASTGNEASAYVIQEAGQRGIRINMKGDVIKLIYEDVDYNLTDVYSDMKQIYNEVRYDENRDN